MLDPNEKLVFDGMMNQLRDEDPSFLCKIERLGRPRRKLRTAVAVLLWTLAPICIFVGGWTGLVLAVVGSAYGAHLAARRDGMADQPTWPSPNNRPGAASF